MKIQFEGMSAEISEEEFSKEEFDVDFNGQQMVRFRKLNDLIIAINGMDGWGNNNISEVFGKYAIIEL